MTFWAHSIVLVSVFKLNYSMHYINKTIQKT